MGNTLNTFCVCNRSASESQMDDFWRNLKFRSLTPEEFFKLYSESANPNKEKIEELFVPNNATPEEATAAKKIYNNWIDTPKEKKYFFVSLMLLLNNRTDFSKWFQELDKINGLNLLDQNKVTKNEWINILRFHGNLVSSRGIPEHIQQGENEVKLKDVYTQDFVEEIIKERVQGDLTGDEFLNSECNFLQNESHIREMIYQKYTAAQQEKNKAKSQ
jgi:hypothetical protein